MAWIPGGFINGEFKTFDQMSVEELEDYVGKSKVRLLIVLGFSIFFAVIVMTLFVMGIHQ